MPVDMSMKELLDQYKNVNSRFEVKNELSDSSGPAEIYIYGTISAGWFSDISSREIKRKLEGITKDEIHVHINSPGGDVFESVAIHNLLKNHKAKISIYIDGIAASGASVIAMAGDQVIMPSNTMMMIHNAWTFTWGNAKELRKEANRLEKIDEGAVKESYLLRFVGERTELDKLLEDDTFLTAKECLALGFADEVAADIELEEYIEEEEDEDEKTIILAKYAARLEQNSEQQNIEPEPEPTPAPKQNMSKLFLNLKKKGE